MLTDESDFARLLDVECRESANVCGPVEQASSLTDQVLRYPTSSETL